MRDVSLVERWKLTQARENALTQESLALSLKADAENLRTQLEQVNKSKEAEIEQLRAAYQTNLDIVSEAESAKAKALAAEAELRKQITDLTQRASQVDISKQEAEAAKRSAEENSRKLTEQNNAIEALKRAAQQSAQETEAWKTRLQNLERERETRERSQGTDFLAHTNNPSGNNTEVWSVVEDTLVTPREDAGEEPDTRVSTEVNSDPEWSFLSVAHQESLDKLREDLKTQNRHLIKESMAITKGAYGMMVSYFTTVTNSQIIRHDREPIRAQFRNATRVNSEVQAKAACRLEELEEDHQRSKRAEERKKDHRPLELKAKLGSFDGDKTKFMGWWRTMEIACIEREDLDEVTKHTTLQEHVTGEAKTAIGYIEFVQGASVKKMIEILQTRFGRREDIVNMHLSELKNLSRIDGGHKTLRAFKDLVTRHITGLEMLNARHMLSEQELCDVYARCIPYELIEKWAEHWDTSTPTIARIQKSLDKALDKHEALERFRQNPDVPKKGKHTQSLTVDVDTGKKGGKAVSFTPNADDKTTPGPEKCLLCGKDHRSYFCRVGTVEERWKKVKNQKLCPRCIRKGHVLDKCTSKFSCKHCPEDASRGHASCLCRVPKKPKKAPTTPADSSATGGASATAANLVAVPEMIIGANRRSGCDGQVITPTFTAMVAAKDGGWIRVLGLIDSGAAKTFIRQELADELGWDPVAVENISIHVFGGTPSPQDNYPVHTLAMKGTSPKTRGIVRIKALANQKLCSLTDYHLSKFALDMVTQGYPMADDRILGKPGFDRGIDIIIGCDHYWSVVTRTAPMGSDHGIAATKSRFGWLIHGVSQSENPSNVTAALVVGATTDKKKKKKPVVKSDADEQDRALGVDLKQFWDLEHLGILAAESSQPSFYEAYAKTITRSEDGRYQVCLPWKDNWKKLQSNKAVAVKRLEGLMRRFDKDQTALAMYHEQFSGYLKEGFIRPANPEYTGVMMYLPHRDVVRVEATTTKCRPVFDGSSHMKGAPSLNQALEVGPNLNPELLEVLMRFRLYETAWVADITKAFLQIELVKEDAEVIRFLWYKDPKDRTSLTEYTWVRLPFGLTCSPFILKAVLFKHLELYEDIYPETVAQLRKQLYVDDWLGGADTLEKALKTIREAIIILREAKMDLAKWITSNRQLEEQLEGEVQFQRTETALVQTSLSADLAKALGVYWNPEKDKFVFQSQKLINEAREMGPRPTKRQVFSLSLRIFDPLGLLSPVILVAKLVMQKIWIAEIGWDEQIPENIKKDWEHFLTGLDQLGKVAIDRWMGTRENDAVDLHAFCDASEDAYAAAVYVRTPTKPRQSLLLCSKTRIAPPPKKSMSIPRLELLSNLLAAKVVSYARNAFVNHQTKAMAWTDSTVALHWIAGESGRWKTFVHNRVEAIRQVFSQDQIRHCPGLENPADIASRGASAAALIMMPEWWYGPSWLPDDEYQWPKPRSVKGDLNRPDVASETKNEISVLTTQVGSGQMAESFYAKHSIYRTLYRVAAWMYRFRQAYSWKKKPETSEGLETVKITRRKQVKVHGLTRDEVMHGKLMCIRLAQKEAWPQDFAKLKKGEKLQKGSKLGPLNPVWDERFEVIRCGGRSSRMLARDVWPMLLPAKHHITVLIMRHVHLEMKHAGAHETQLELRKYYYIPKAYSQIKNELGRCISCQRNNARRFNAPASELPELRTRTDPPFTVVGIDYAGPYDVYTERHASNKEPPPVKKAYICVFTCAVSRAIHIEPATDSSVISFLYALKKMVAMRGMPKVIISDNGTNFTGAEKALEKFRKTKYVGEWLSVYNIQWKFIPAKAPWWGGFWERMVKTMKYHMCATFRTKILDWEQFDCFLKEVSYVMNCRPMTRVDQESGVALTPIHILTGKPGHCQEFDPTDEEHEPNWKHENGLARVLELDVERQRSFRDWYQHFTTEYLTELRKFDSPDGQTQKLPEIGQVVIIHDQLKPRNAWITGRVTALIESEDKVVRQVRLVNGVGAVMTRPIQQLYPLEVEAGVIDPDAANVGKEMARNKRRVAQTPAHLRRVTGPPIEEPTGNIIGDPPPPPEPAKKRGRPANQTQPVKPRARSAGATLQSSDAANPTENE